MLGEVCVALKRSCENLLLAKIAKYNALINKSPSKVYLDVASLISKVHTDDLVSDKAKSGLLRILDKEIKEPIKRGQTSENKSSKPIVKSLKGKEKAS
ncbi:hypothetical protein G9A89_008447 [Geosiphon pyriformis]|nr:hypothetical protein G9A89_008447 [Geosiphon pyriformis]